MPRHNDKWLALFLALLLGLSPFTRAMADIVPTPAHGPGHTAMAMETAADDNTCEACSTAHSCGSSSCACYQCGTCTATILHELPPIPFASLAALTPPSVTTKFNDHPFLLFRPPRA